VEKLRVLIRGELLVVAVQQLVVVEGVDDILGSPRRVPATAASSSDLDEAAGESEDWAWPICRDGSRFSGPTFITCGAVDLRLELRGADRKNTKETWGFPGKTEEVNTGTRPKDRRWATAHEIRTAVIVLVGILQIISISLPLLALKVRHGSTHQCLLRVLGVSRIR
jgi:hypothetical protein